MRSITLEDSIVTGALVNRGQILIPAGGKKLANWPTCMTCGRECEACEIKNVNSKGCDLWARCHGKEDACHVHWHVPIRDASKDAIEDVNIGWAIKRAIRDFAPFMPGHSHDLSSRRA